VLFGAQLELDVEEARGPRGVMGAAGSVGPESVVGGCSIVQAGCPVALTKVV